MRAPTTIHKQNIIALIDSEFTHNFISEKVANKLRLLEAPTEPFSVKVTSGSPMRCKGQFENVPIFVRGIHFFLIFYSLPLIGLSLVLGIQWSEELETVECDWKQMMMAFQWQEWQHQLCSLNAPPIQSASFEEIFRSLPTKHFLYAVCLIAEAVADMTTKEPELQWLLKEFRMIFEEPDQLPAVREVDHYIPFKDDTKLINIRPYHYSYFQKTKIEKQVADMLSS